MRGESPLSPGVVFEGRAGFEKSQLVSPNQPPSLAHNRRKTLSLNRSEKEAVVSEVTGLVQSAQTLVLAEYRGIAVADMIKLRAEARNQGVSLSVLKNTLARRAVAGSGFDVVSDQMTGPLIYGFSEDAVAAARVVANFAKTNDKLVIRGGVTSGRALDVNAVKMLASVPSKEVLLSQLCGLLMSPMSRIAVVLGALQAQKEAAGGAPAVAAAPAAEAAPAEAPAAEAPAADAPAA